MISLKYARGACGEPFTTRAIVHVENIHERLHNTAVWYLARGDLIAWFSHPSRSSIRPLHYDIQSRTSLGTGSEASSNMIPLLLEANY